MLAELDLRQGDLESAQARFEETLGFVRELNDRRWVASCLAKLGKVAYELERYQKARHLFRESLSVAEELGEKRTELIDLTMLGRIENRLGDFQEAGRLLHKALRIAKEGQTVPDILRILLEVAKGLNASGQPRKAAAILRLVLGHPSARKSTLEDAEKWQAELIEEHGADRIASEAEKGVTWDLDDTVDSVISGSFASRIRGNDASTSNQLKAAESG
jgi:tetratricopeptide (TPR) repeat protein